MSSGKARHGGRSHECSRLQQAAKVLACVCASLASCGDKRAENRGDTRAPGRDGAPASVSDAALPHTATDASPKRTSDDTTTPRQPRTLPAPPPLSPDEATARRAQLAGRWVSETGLESITWHIDPAGTVTETVHQRGHKGPPLRSRTFATRLERSGEFVADQPSGARRYRYMIHKRRLYASDRYGVFPLPPSRQFSVEADGIAIRYGGGRCTGTLAGGASIDVTCKYTKSGPLEVFTTRYLLTGRPRHTMTVFHKVGPYLVHETMLSCCEFKRR